MILLKTLELFCCSPSASSQEGLLAEGSSSDSRPKQLLRTRWSLGPTQSLPCSGSNFLMRGLPLTTNTWSLGRRMISGGTYMRELSLRSRDLRFTRDSILASIELILFLDRFRIYRLVSE